MALHVCAGILFSSAKVNYFQVILILRARLLLTGTGLECGRRDKRGNWLFECVGRMPIWQCRQMHSDTQSRLQLLKINKQCIN